MGSFLSSLVGGYANTMLQRHKEERDREDKEREAELGLIQAAMNSGQLPPDQMQAAFKRADEIIHEYTGKGKGKKGGFSLGNLIGRFSDVGGEGQGGAAATGATAAPPSKVSLGTPPARSGTSSQTGVNLGAPPQRGSEPFSPTFRSQADVISENELAQVRAQTKAMDERQKAEIKSATDAYMQAFPQASKADVFNNVIAPMYGIKPPLKTETKQVEDKNSPTGWSWRTSDMNTGQQIGQNVLGAPPPTSEKQTSADQKKEDIIAGYMKQGMSRQQAEEKYQKESAKQFSQKGEPTTSTSTVVESVEGGPAITRQTSTTRSKGGAQALGVGHSVLGPDGTPKHEPLQFAPPKEGRAAIRKDQDAYEDAKARYTVMKDTMEKIRKDPNAAGQGDILILSNHIGMTWSAQKGGRIPITIWKEAQSARPFLQGIQVKIQGNAVTGAVLSPEQRQYMVDLADEQTRVAQAKLLDEQVRYGIMVKVQPTKGPNAGKTGYIPKEKFDADPTAYKKIP